MNIEKKLRFKERSYRILSSNVHNLDVEIERIKKSSTTNNYLVAGLIFLITSAVVTLAYFII